MTLEKQLRFMDNNGVIGNIINLGDVTLEVVNDIEGVLEVKLTKESSVETMYLNGDKFFKTHEEAFNSEL